jgi:hypothetical protein
MISVSRGVTRIEVAPDEVLRSGAAGIGAAARRERGVQNGYVTGARVTVEFTRHRPLPANQAVRVHYDIAENGEVRELAGMPTLTHTEVHRDGGHTYHYRISGWIEPSLVMKFVQH